MNRRVFGVPGRARTSGTRLELAAFDATSAQRWQFSVVAGHPGYGCQEIPHTRARSGYLLACMQDVFCMWKTRPRYLSR